AGGGSTSRCCSRSHERAGVETERQEKCAVSITENHLSGSGITCSDRVACKSVSTIAGSDGSCVQRDTFWPAVHETATVVAQNQG
ncbi:hypothetical protein M9458_041684, partial [Cirrhinus mrigala]